MELGENAQLALDVIMRKPTKGIPGWLLHPMQHSVIEQYAGAQPGDYKKNPEDVYIRFQRNIGTCFLDQYIPDNPLTMGDSGFEGTGLGTNTGAEQIVCDGIVIDSPEAVVEHMERFQFPGLEKAIQDFDEEAHIEAILQEHGSTQEKLGNNILKTQYGFVRFPYLGYSGYGYEAYFCAYVLYPEMMEKMFSMQADFAEKTNAACAKAMQRGNLPPLYRLDHDMADSRGTLVNIKSLDEIWFPHFARSIKPMVDANATMIWHCDGNLMEMVPRLLEVGLKGFQGFQYEDGMDYEKICSMKDKDGEELFIIAGVSVTRTLPFGTPDDVVKELKFLVEKGPKVSLTLGGSSTITPGVSDENMKTLIEGMKYYRENGRG